MTRFEKILGILGLVIGLLALFMSILSYLATEKLQNERIAFDKELSKSKIVIQIGRDIHQETLVFEQYEDLPEFGAIFKQRYNLIINNIGLQPASITDWSVVGKSQMKDPDTGKNMYGWYKGMDLWFYTKGGAPVNFPISIEPKKPQMFVI